MASPKCKVQVKFKWVSCMRENTKIMNLILNIAKEDYRIRAAFLTGSKVNPLEKRDDMQDYDVIYCVTEVEDFSVDSSFLEKLDPIFVYSPEVAKKQVKEVKKEVNYNILLEDGVKIDIRFYPVDKITELVSTNTLLSLLMDKDNLIKQLPMSSDVSLRTMRPTKNEFEQTIYEFFLNIIETLPYLYRYQYVGATLAYRKVEDSLLKMLSWYIGYTKDYKINFGKDYKNIEVYIEEDHKEIFFDSITYTDIESLWKAVFASLSYFRKLGLAMAERLNFPYPKQTDVSLVKYVREIRDKAGRISNRNIIA